MDVSALVALSISLNSFLSSFSDRLHETFDGSSSFDPYRVAPFKGQKSQTGSTLSQDGGAVKTESKVMFTNPTYTQPIYPAAQLDV